MFLSLTSCDISSTSFYSCFLNYEGFIYTIDIFCLLSFIARLFKVKTARVKYMKANSHKDVHSGRMFENEASICDSFINPSMPEVEGNNLPKYL